MLRKTGCLLILLLAILLVPGQLEASVDAAPASQAAGPPQGVVHVVERGETLFLIAERYGTTVDAVAHANGLPDPTKIYVGQRLTIPGASVGVGPEATRSLVVQPGDSLVTVAKRYATTWRDVARLNGLLSPGALSAGQVIRVPVAGQPSALNGGLEVVAHGDTLFRLALRHGVRPQTLARVNSLHNPALIYSGQLLVVPGRGGDRLPAPFRSVELQPLPVPQGSTLVVTVRTDGPATVDGTVFDRSVAFAEENGLYYGLVGVHVFAEPGLYEMPVRAVAVDGRSAEITLDVVVEADRFGHERIQVPTNLLDPDVGAPERIRLNALRALNTEERVWSDVFEPPCGGTVSSYFGTHRAYNDGPYTSYHGGVDLRGSTGTPVYAPAAGTVVLAEELVVRGNAVVLDHGWGVMTGYWHLSKIEVGLGQRVDRGDLIARIGNTGLSTGSHLHWEMWVGGVNVNPLQWIDRFYPWPEEGEEPEDGGLE